MVVTHLYTKPLNNNNNNNSLLNVRFGSLLGLRGLLLMSQDSLVLTSLRVFDVLDPCSRSSQDTYARSPTAPIYTRTWHTKTLLLHPMSLYQPRIVTCT